MGRYRCAIVEAFVVFWFRLLGRFVPLILFPFSSVAAPQELPVSADRCAIYFALTEDVGVGCAPPSVRDLGVARRLPPTGFDLGAAPLSSTPQEQGYFIRFPFNSHDLTEEYRAHLARLGEVLKSDMLIDSCIKLVGHADSVGSAQTNLQLSQARARKVATTLVVASNIATERIVTEARGELALLSGVPGPHPLNRRVEILARARDGTICQ
ncbi:hypothetical protein NBRC116594_30060 [Shimia sp. NS0008-38b]|uniref:OmpA family protein n=1 Tax=Shimia sp. NS0008-38b TaxID=3127653 RepID=UPI003102D9CD